MYEMIMILLAAAFVALITGCLYHKHLAKVAKMRAEKLARIRTTTAWLRQNVHLPKFVARRKEQQEARTKKWARQAEERGRQRELGKRVKRILDPYWNLDVEVRDEARKLGKLPKAYPLTSDENLVRK
ncbi:MAG: hypothetical protein Q7R85_01055 [bacterium]|nr:hypothetical protein [bacterium]